MSLYVSPLFACSCSGGMSRDLIKIRVQFPAACCGGSSFRKLVNGVASLGGHGQGSSTSLSSWYSLVHFGGKLK